MPGGRRRERPSALACRPERTRFHCEGVCAMTSGVLFGALSGAQRFCSPPRVRYAALAAAVALLAGRSQASRAQQAPAADGATTLFQNVRIFDGKNGTLSAASNVLVRGNKIETISTQPIAVDRRADTRIIDGGGRTLM